MEVRSFLQLKTYENLLIEGVKPNYQGVEQKKLANVIQHLIYAPFSTEFFYNGKSYRYIGGHSFEFSVNYVPGTDSGPLCYGPDKKYRILIIGEQPSYVESTSGLNFVGDFGFILKETLKRCGFKNFDEIYVVNASRIYAPGSHKLILCRTFLPLLAVELGKIQPEIILCLGNSALKIFSRRKLDEVIDDPEEIVIQTISFNNRADIAEFKSRIFAAPLSATKEFSESLRFQEAIRRFVSEIQEDTKMFPSVNIVPLPQHCVIRDVESLRTFVSDVLKAADESLQILTCDLEWEGRSYCSHGAFLRVIGFYWDKTETAYLIVLTDQEGNPLMDSTIVAEEIDKIFGHPNTQIVGHYFISDCAWLLSLGCKNIISKFFIPEDISSPDYPGIFDTLSAHHSYDETGHFGLKDAGRILLRYKDWSTEVEAYVKQKKTQGFGSIPDEILFPYLLRDLYVTRKLRDYHAKNLNADRFGNSCWHSYVSNIRVLPAYLEMSYVGVLVDTQLLKELEKRYNNILMQIEEQLQKSIGWPEFNPRSPQQRVVALFGSEYLLQPAQKEKYSKYPSLHLTPFKSTSGSAWDASLKGKETPSTDLESLQYLSSEHEFVKLLRDYSLIQQVIKTFLGPNGIIQYVCNGNHGRRIHPLYFPYLETRRASSSKPNMQNLPAEEKEKLYEKIAGPYYINPIRYVFIADPGHVFVNVDYIGAELLMLGIMSQDEGLIEDYYKFTLPDDDPNKLDIHSLIAVIAFKLNCPPTKKGLISVGKEELRLAAKRIIFGLNYGRQAESILQQLKSAGIKISLEDVQKIIETIYDRYPKVRSFQNEVRKRVREKKWLANCFRNYRRFYEGRMKEDVAEKEREALNFTCQSGVADAISLAMTNFMLDPRKAEINYRIVMQHHDALTFLVPENKVDDFLNVVEDCMKTKVPIYMTTLDGERISDKPYYFGYSYEITKRFK